MDNTTSTLKRWTRPNSYIGPEYPEYYLLDAIADVVDPRDRATGHVALVQAERELVYVAADVLDGHWRIAGVAGKRLTYRALIA